MAKPVVFVTRKTIPQAAMDILTQKYQVINWTHDDVIPREELLKAVANVDGLFCVITEKIDRELIDAAPKLKVVGTMSVGIEHIQLDVCEQRRIAVGYTPDVLTETTAELAIGLLLCTARRILEAAHEVYEGRWPLWDTDYMSGVSIANSTVGIIGLGRIGRSVAEKIQAFKPKVILYFNRHQAPESAKTSGAVYVPLNYLLSNSDFVILCCGLTTDAVRLINKETLSLMKPNAILINVSRGGVVDQDDLYDALKHKRLRAAGLDVTVPEPLPKDHKLLTLDNIVILPHIGSATIATRTRMATLTAENIVAGLTGQPLPASAL